MKFRRCEGEKEIFFFFLERFTDSEVVRCELELSEVREACVSEVVYNDPRKSASHICVIPQKN